MSDEEERRISLPRNIFAPSRLRVNQLLGPRSAILDVDRRYSAVSPIDTKVSHFEGFASAGFDAFASRAIPACSAPFVDIVKMVAIPAEE